MQELTDPGHRLAQGPKPLRVGSGTAGRGFGEGGPFARRAHDEVAEAAGDRLGDVADDPETLGVDELVGRELHVRDRGIEVRRIQQHRAARERLVVGARVLSVGDDAEVGESRGKPLAARLREQRSLALELLGDRLAHQREEVGAQPPLLFGHLRVLGAHPRGAQVLDRDDEELRVVEVERPELHRSESSVPARRPADVPRGRPRPSAGLRGRPLRGRAAREGEGINSCVDYERSSTAGSGVRGRAAPDPVLIGPTRFVLAAVVVGEAGLLGVDACEVQSTA